MVAHSYGHWDATDEFYSRHDDDRGIKPWVDETLSDYKNFRKFHYSDK